MANFTGTTVTEQVAEIKDLPALNKYLEGFYVGGGEGEIHVDTADNNLCIYGYEWLDVYKDNNGDIDWDESVIEQFFDGLRKHIKSPLVIIMVGTEKCRYASATRITVTPDGVEWLSL